MLKIAPIATHDKELVAHITSETAKLLSTLSALHTKMWTVQLCCGGFQHLTAFHANVLIDAMVHTDLSL